MVAQDRKPKDIDSHIPGQEFEALLDSHFALVEALAGDAVGATQESASHAAIETVANADFGRIEHELSGNAGHAATPLARTSEREPRETL